ncbi:MAG: protein kinase domain-containing protein, partial [Planctomycetota bacterium]
MSGGEPARIGPYEIEREIGRGGMGVVYLARDTTLDRDVAIKTLPEHFADDPDRLSRFEREAKALASLNHASIASIYGVQEADGKRYLVLEHVPGPTLDEILAQGPMPVSEALPVAKQIVDAIEAAHQRGIIHRDLKPANIKFADGEQVKVLDFGLAKAVEDPPSSESDLAASPTYLLSNTPTMPGVVLGTAGYLSPEQARGRQVDKRTDIFSFGCVLYEMLVGRTVFPGETATDSIGATLHKEPSWDDLPADTPPTILLLLRRCLAKDRKRRLHDIADARVEIEDAITDPTSSSLNLARSAVAAGATAPARPFRMIAGVLLGLVLGAVVVGAIAAAFWPSAEPKQVRRLTIIHDPEPESAAISPNGTMIAFGTDLGPHLRRLSSLDTELLWAEEDRIDDIYWSPDSEWIGFRTDDQLRRIAARGGRPIDVAEVGQVDQVRWTDDGHLTIGDFVDGTIIRIPAQGGASTTEVPKLEDEMHLHSGAALPASRGTLFLPHRNDGSAASTLYVWTGGERRALYEWDEAMHAPEYSASGHLLFTRYAEPRGTWALPFSLDRLEVTGVPFLVAPGASSFSISRTGDLVYLPGRPRERRPGRSAQLAWMDREGQVTERFGPTFYGTRGIALSPDGSRVAVAAQGLSEEETDAEPNIWIVEVQRGTASRLAAEEAYQVNPSWSSDGRRIAYMTGTRLFADGTVVARLVDGSGPPETIAQKASFYSLTDDWSTVAYVEMEGAAPWNSDSD